MQKRRDRADYLFNLLAAGGDKFIFSDEKLLVYWSNHKMLKIKGLGAVSKQNNLPLTFTEKKVVDSYALI